MPLVLKSSNNKLVAKNKSNTTSALAKANSSTSWGVLKSLRRSFFSYRVRPEVNEPTALDHRSARVIQRAWCRQRFLREYGEPLQHRWMRLVDAVKEQDRREKKTYIKNRKHVIEQTKRIRDGGALRKNWKYLKQPPGGVDYVSPYIPIEREVVWTNHDVALFVGLFWKVGVPKGNWFGSNNDRFQPYFNELCPQFTKDDVVRMFWRLKQQGTIEDMNFLVHLTDSELDRLLPPWVADDIKKKK
jgi:hypothetical protein